MKASLMPMPLTIPPSLQGEQGEGRGYKKRNKEMTKFGWRRHTPKYKEEKSRGKNKGTI